MTSVEIAQVIHEVISAQSRFIESRKVVDWGELAVPDQEMYVGAVEWIKDDPTVTPQSVHDYWRTSMMGRGWVYGPVKDVGKLEHPCMVPYEALPAYEAAKDVVFMTLARVLA